MSKRSTIKVIQTDLLDHPAVRAWHELQSNRAKPEEIAILKDKRHSSIYRLRGVGPRGGAVIAKRCQRSTGVIERTIYQDVLPYLPVAALRCYGFLEREDGQSWLFLEDAGGERYSPLLGTHRTFAARWLGLMHTSAPQVAAAAHLPYRGLDHYRKFLLLARDTILQNRANPALNSDDLSLLETIVSQCDFLELHWNELERFCDRMPCTLVHGDFKEKNVYLRTSGEGTVVLPLDWEEAGWGIPAPDLFSVDLPAYWAVVREAWPHIDFHDIGRLGHCGTILRWLAETCWKCMDLPYEWVEKPLKHLRVCQAGMADSIRAAEWEH